MRSSLCRQMKRCRRACHANNAVGVPRASAHSSPSTSCAAMQLDELALLGNVSYIRHRPTREQRTETRGARRRPQAPLTATVIDSEPLAWASPMSRLVHQSIHSSSAHGETTERVTTHMQLGLMLCCRDAPALPRFRHCTGRRQPDARILRALKLGRELQDARARCKEVLDLVGLGAMEQLGVEVELMPSKRRQRNDGRPVLERQLQALVQVGQEAIETGHHHGDGGIARS